MANIQVLRYKINALANTGANGPFVLQGPASFPIVLWTTAAAGSSIAVTYSNDGGASQTPVAMSVPSGCSNA
ncbi:MAG: hypothetical protein ACYCRF_11240, partial [Acidithiobacillus sp.]